jgi:hypothetical protein
MVWHLPSRYKQFPPAWVVKWFTKIYAERGMKIRHEYDTMVQERLTSGGTPHTQEPCVVEVMKSMGLTLPPEPEPQP